MQCPHCLERISFFSKAMNRFGKIQSCPHCEGLFTKKFNKGHAWRAVPFMAVLHYLLMPTLGVYAAVPGIIVMVASGYDLLPAEDEELSKGSADLGD